MCYKCLRYNLDTQAEHMLASTHEQWHYMPGWARQNRPSAGLSFSI